jgi:hypothetical protein
MPKPTLAQLQLAVARIRADFGRTRGIVAVSLAMRQGRPLVLLHGSGPAQPTGLPSAFRMVLNPQGDTYPLPIRWRSAAHTSNKQMWGGATPVTKLFPRVIEQSHDPRAPEFPSGENIPTDAADYQFALGCRRPPFVVPNYWGKPLELQGTACFPTYNTWVNVLAHQVRPTDLVVITGASYEFNNCLQLLDQFQVQVQETGIGRNAAWIDMYASANADPAFQFAFGGHCQPIPLMMIVDHDQTVTARMLVLGQYPFSNSQSATLGGCGTLYLHGFISKLVSPLDVGSRSSDIGSIAEGGDGMLGDITPGGVA